MKKINIIYFTIAFAFILISCKPSIDKNREKITIIEKEIFAPNATFDSLKVKQLIEMYIDFADRFPADTSAGKYLFSASRLYVSITRFQQSIDLLDKIIAKYPQEKFISDCYFLKAYIYDDKMKDYKNAFKCYNDFLAKYPNNDLAPAAKASIETLGVPAEALIKSFEQKNAAKVDSIKS